MSGIRSGIMRHAVAVFAATATLVFRIGEHIGHETVIYEVGRVLWDTPDSVACVPSGLW